jgi:ribosomal protein S18 acetylase RimI-like enzyme
MMLQLELECKGVVAGQTLVRIPGAEPDDIPRVHVVRLDDTYQAFVRHDVSASLRQALATLSPEEAFADHERVQAILASDALCTQLWRGHSYVFPPLLPTAVSSVAVRLDDRQHRDLLAHDEHWSSVGGKTVYGVIVGNRIVSACGSARENSRSAEAWVITAPEFRRRGYARQVTASWAADVQAQGKVPFYSHVVDNMASRAVALSLGLRPFLAAVAYT